MPPKKLTDSKAVQSLRKIALRLPEAAEGVVCNKAAFKAGNKSFLFVGADDGSYNTMLKLRDSLPEAEKLAARESKRYGVGASGWVSASFSHEESAPPGLMERWIEESYRLLVPKKLVALLPARGAAVAKPASAGKSPAKRK